MPPAIYALPTLITLGNLLCGFLAIVWATGEGSPADWAPACLILLAMLLDGIDGLVARRMGLASDFGARLDGLSDLVSFGIAPAVLACSSWPGRATLGVAAWFVCAAALRLAAFVEENQGESTERFFTGLPAPAAAGVVAGGLLAELSQSTLLMALAMLGLLMVSPLRYPHPTTLLMRRISLPFAALLALAAGVCLLLGGYAPLVICVLFVLSPLAIAAGDALRRRRESGWR